MVSLAWQRTLYQKKLEMDTLKKGRTGKTETTNTESGLMKDHRIKTLWSLLPTRFIPVYRSNYNKLTSSLAQDIARYLASSFWIKSQVRSESGSSRLAGILGPKRVLPWSIVQPRLAMEHACELGTNSDALRPWDKLYLRDLDDPQLQALELEQDLLLLIGDPICSLFITGYRGEEEARKKHSLDG
ncbi:hypothetical protein V6N12_034593 [Hibiscus sabdariffa]|uniref:Uncharacterized protein n=1 Tax=Hibiscus sabdariffa TaxID=183260 RepID=A0ABR2DHK8_9ROSI